MSKFDSHLYRFGTCAGLADCEKNMWPIFTAEMLISQRPIVDINILFGKEAHFLYPKIRKMLIRNLYGKANSALDLDLWL